MEVSDCWGRPFQYEKVNDRECRIISLGADGKPGGTAEDADIVKVVRISE
jgi:hypothetical protein